MISKSLLKKSVAEFIGTLAIVLFGCGAIAVATKTQNHFLLANVPLVFGLIITVMIYAVGHISGAHFNPAVTLAFASVKRFPFAELPVYWAAQFLGAITGALLLVFFIPDLSTFGATIPNIALGPAVLFEALLSFFLMFVIIAVATDSRAVGIMAGAAIGLTVAVDAFFGGALTGASMNPARSLAPAIMEGRFEHLWVYFVGPVLGTCSAAFVYEWIRCEDDKGADSDKHAKGCC